ncbi:MAG: hypothetical protein J6X33_06340 [Clostridiales bacterium]|nr:hypothetical protein [Clostridiales bacterium]
MGKMFYDIRQRSVAAVLCIAMVMGFAGCDMFGVRKQMGVMYGRLTNFNKAMNELDIEAARENTDWTEEDDDYKAVKDLFDITYNGDAVDEGFVSCTEYIASTINIKFDITSAKIDDDPVTLNMKYETVDWQSVYGKSHNSYDEVLEDLKNCQDKITVDGVVTFVNADEEGDWKISEITELSEVMNFVHTLPDIS